MTRILACLLIFMLAYGESNGSMKFPDMKKVIKRADEILQKVLPYYDVVRSFTNTDSEKMNQALEKLNEISSELKLFSINNEIKLDQKMSTLLTNLQVRIRLQPLQYDLTKYLNTVEEYYNDAMDYGSDNKTFTIFTLTNFANLVLSTSENLPKTLQDIHKLFANRNRNGYLRFLLQDTRDNVQNECDKGISAQQEMYFIYISVIIAEMQAFDVLTNVYLIKQIFEKDHYNYTNELMLAKNRYESRLTDYNNIISQYLSQFSREIRRCDVNPPKRDINFIEVEGVARARIHDEHSLREPAGPVGDSQKAGQCWELCSSISDGGPAWLDGDRVTDCQYLGKEVKVCPAEQHSHREHLWWKTNEATYGHDEICDNEISLSRSNILGYRCNICVCSVYKHWRSKTREKYINLTPELSDVANNMVVTGVQFIKEYYFISLQIQQNKFLSGGMSNDTGSWKSINGDKSAKLINYGRRSLYLDDVMVPDGYAVTGVRFQLAEDPSGFQLGVHATPFDLNTGKLDVSRGKWIVAGDSAAPRLPDYDRTRDEIHMGDADDPVRGSAFNYDPETNKFIKFRHTSLLKDAGQTTIPFIETLPVESALPLSGIGISFKGKEGFGGYIAPRIYTMDLSKYIDVV